MGSMFRTIAVIALLASVTAVHVDAGQAPFIVPPVEEHTIDSKFVDQSFEIYVQKPIMLADGSERFPVLYLTDCTGGLPFGVITGLMQLWGDVPRFIMVGIGYPADNAAGGLRLRERDLTPTEVDTPQSSTSTYIDGIIEVTDGKKSGGAAEFLRFIREELQPFIDASYPTVPGDRGYFGDSLGGLFGLYVLFNQPDTFSRYIIGSPSAWWDGEVIFKQAEEFVASSRPVAARVFIAVGALEEVGAERAPHRMVTNVYRLETLLRSAGLEGLELSTYTFPNETHSSVFAMNYIRGVRTVYEKPEAPFYRKADLMMKPMAEAADRE